MGMGGFFFANTGKNFEINGQSIVAWYQSSGRHRPSELVLRVLGAFRGQAVFRSENALDQIGKGMGLNQEIQLGDPAVDQACYFECDDELFVRDMFASQDARTALKELLKNFNVVEIHPASCVAKKTGCRNWIDSDPAKVAAGADALARLVPYIPAPVSGVPSATPVTDAFRLSERLFVLVSCGLLFFGILALALRQNAFEPVVMGPIALASLKVSIPVWIAFLVLAGSRLKGHAATMRVLGFVALISVVGFGLFGWVGAVMYNGALDRSQPQTHHVQVMDKRISRGKNSTTYYVQVSSWRPDMSSRDLAVGFGEYNQMSIGRPYVVVTQEGALGHEWITRHYSL